MSLHIANEVLDYFKENNIDIVTYPPNVTDELQGLDKVLFRPLKNAYNKHMNECLRQGEQINMSNLPS